MHNKIFGQYGGIFVPETLMQPLKDLQKEYELAKKDDNFWKDIGYDLTHFVGRQTPLYFAKNWSNRLQGGKIYLKREDLNHTGAHKINNCIGQAYLAKRMGKSRIIAETGAGQHGVATSTVCARMNLDCTIFMGSKDMKRQAQNVYRMKLLGAKVIGVDSGSCTLKDAMNEAMRDWVMYIDSTYYMIGTASGPTPYPQMVRDFQCIIGRETKTQCVTQFGCLPDVLVACVGGGSNAIGLFHPFVDERAVKMVGVEAGGMGQGLGQNAAPLSFGSVGVLHGNKTYLLQDNEGQIAHTHSISAGLDYPGVGPEHAYLKDLGRVTYTSVDDQQALDAFLQLTREEGIIPALESSHGLAYVEKIAPNMTDDQHIVVNLSGRGDKDMATVGELLA